MNDQMTYILIGGIGQLALWLMYKILKNPKIYLGLFGLTILIALFGYFNMDRESLQMVNGNASYWTFFPILFMIYYWIFRQLFLKTFKNEPLMTGYMQSSWEQGEYRKLHMGDVMFTILTLILPFVTTLIF
ncbi:MAG: hypothetical protein COA88_10830 [Kordia sp.]|nr:MAG: hypothetical protein COA88_10830 [Kordia sp.]